MTSVARLGVHQIALEADIGPCNVFDAMFGCNQELSKRNIDHAGRRGVYGDWGRVRRELSEHFMHEHHMGKVFKATRPPGIFHLCGIAWEHDPRLGPHLIAAWHPSAIIPPATVLRPDGIVYCLLHQR